MSTLTLAEHPGHGVDHASSRRRPARAGRLVSGRLALVLMSSFGALTSFYLMLSVTPMYAMSAGTGSAGAGLVTGSLMLATVVAELVSAGLLRRCGYRAVLTGGSLLLGVPALALLVSHSLGVIVVVSAARGLGFGFGTVVIGALVAATVPPERRGEGLGLAGAVSCVPAIVALPSGVWLARNAGEGVVVAITAVSALVPLAAVPWLRRPAGVPDGREPCQVRPDGPRQPAGKTQPAGLLASLRSGRQLRPSLVFAATTVSAGVVAAFLPLASGVSGGTAALGLLAQAVASTASRWWAGRRGDRHGHAGLLIPGLLTATAGMMALIWVTAPAVLTVAMCVFGIGFGIIQNATFALMIDRAPAGGYGTASALWNLAFDAGYGAGPLVFGLFVAHTGYPAAFGLTGSLMLAALLPAARDPRCSRSGCQQRQGFPRRPRARGAPPGGAARQMD